MVAYGGSLWVIGGNLGGREVWRSKDGAVWVSVTLSGEGDGEAFPKRQRHQAVAWQGSLWVVGGFGGGALGDVWRSGNGSVWVEVTVSGEGDGEAFFGAVGASVGGA